MMFTCIYEKAISADADPLMKAVCIWSTRPHIINRKLIGAKILSKYHYLNPQDFESTLSTLRTLKLNFPSEESEVKKSLLEKCNLPVAECSSEICDKCERNRLELKCLIPKNQSQNSKIYEIVVTDKPNYSVLFCDVSYASSTAASSAYYISFQNNVVKLFINSENIFDSNHKWLTGTLLPKIIKWAENRDFFRTEGSVTVSLRLVGIDKYSELYNTLKEKYGKSIVKIWPEVTDPLKFVYEDVAIATYLLILWSTQKKFQKFIDLGCGNGLLVHILNSEGHAGLGLDVRPRKIWDLYPEKTKLKVEAITPSDNTLYPDADWLIGNHSDELTPWIPVMAARSSYHCNIFLLPCCAYKFNGMKYQRKNSSKSLYSDYMDYIKYVCDSCGFVTETDKLRIPSTKRCCFVSQKRTYQLSEHEINSEKIKQFINQECENSPAKLDETLPSPKKSKWSDHFTPREKEEKVKNCTQIDRTVVSKIVDVIVQELLQRQRAIMDRCADMWEADYGAEISVLAKLIPREDLAKLKSECGGLQTLLRNHHHVFQMKDGKVIFRKPEIREKHANWKRKPCWFFYNHPASCALADEECSFAH